MSSINVLPKLRRRVWIVVSRETVDAKPLGRRFFNRDDAIEFQAELDKLKVWGSVLYEFAAGEPGSFLFPNTYLPPTNQVHYDPEPIPGDIEE